MQPIFVGDVQGCGEELQALLVRAEREFGDEFTLWPVGDLINRGPRNHFVLEQVRTLWELGRAHPVLGNHEIALLRLAAGQREEAPDDTFQELLRGPDAAEWCDWIRQWPLVREGRLGSRAFVLVHAAVAPGWTRSEILRRAGAIETRLRGPEAEGARFLAGEFSGGGAETDAALADDLARMTRCRGASADGSWESREPASADGAWHVPWRAARPDYGVVYGHWARQGLHRAAGLRGLDTGCVYHGNGRDGFLTAWLPDLEGPDPFALPDERFWQVRALHRYWSPPKG